MSFVPCTGYPSYGERSLAFLSILLTKILGLRTAKDDIALACQFQNKLEILSKVVQHEKFKLRVLNFTKCASLSSVVSEGKNAGTIWVS